MSDISWGHLATSGGGGAAAAQTPSLQSTSPTLDTNGLHVSAVQDADGWIDIEYNDGTGAFPTAVAGAVYDLGSLVDLTGAALVGLTPNDLIAVSLEVDAIGPDDVSVCAFLTSSNTMPTEGFGPAMTSDGVGWKAHVYRRALTAVSATSFVATTRGVVTKVVPRISAELAGIAVSAMTYTAAGAWTGDGSAGQEVFTCGALERLVVSVGTVAGSGSGTKTVRFRAKTMLLSTADLRP